jgi:cytochrome c oxidase subunit I
VLAAALVLEIDRKLSEQVFSASSWRAISWQRLFCFFGPREVYIVALPFFGIATEIRPVFSRKPLFGYKGLVDATIAVAGLSLTMWAHHMFTTGAELLPVFSFMTFLIAVPTGVKFLNWVGTIWRGQPTFEPPMIFILGFLVVFVFVFGGLTGVIWRRRRWTSRSATPASWSRPLRAVRHRGVLHVRRFYFWWPKWTGKVLDTTLGKWHFWSVFIGFNMTFLVQHWLGLSVDTASATAALITKLGLTFPVGRSATPPRSGPPPARSSTRPAGTCSPPASCSGAAAASSSASTPPARSGAWCPTTSPD